MPYVCMVNDTFLLWLIVFEAMDKSDGNKLFQLLLIMVIFSSYNQIVSVLDQLLINLINYRTYYSNVDINSSTNSSVKSSTIPRRANYYYEPYDVPNNFHKNNNNHIDPRHNSCNTYAADSCCDSEIPYQTNINHGTARAPMLPPIGRNNR